ncbi:interleukin-12 receptor subunit beta-2-like [Sinocyclocheilus rhinocerous]|uniref:interleukin-12 receptor subunit beta-2-like n=1 Tax=Sinocyclocheilus rhinocerous TaxID=307959 RepID=UPI0007B8FCCB|nr:PREDICTED: interleukin-12 receptor subunit beta-2-like [Sinocyclocheilus rhinocerous]
MLLAGTVCTVRSSKGEVLLGSNFTFSCIFNKQCTKLIFRNGTQIKYKKKKKLIFRNGMQIKYKKKTISSEVSVDIENITEFSTFSCRCEENPEPCGLDIKPGYPPDIPQNLTCVQKMNSRNVSCIWTTGRGTIIDTTCQLRVHGDLGYESIMNSTGFCHSTFPIKSSIMSQLVVLLNVSNTLGSKTSGPHTINLINIVKPSMPEIVNVSCSSRWCNLHTDNHSMSLVEIQYSPVNGIWDTFQTNAKSRLNVSSLHPDTTYNFQIRRKINHTVGLWSDWSQPKQKKTKEEAPDKALDVWYLQELKPPQSKSKCFRIFWKELNISDAKGKIQRYNISVQEQKGKRNSIIAVPPSRNQSICCSNCSVSVSAVNSEGQSPVKIIQLRFPGLVTGLLSHRPLNNHSIALFWPKLDIAGTEYVVHWYPVGNIEGIQWIRVVDTTAHITGLQPQECYQCAVTALRSSGPKMATIKGISSWQSAPEQGPVPQLGWKESEMLSLTWSEIPQKKRRGCLKKYTVYLIDKLKGDIHNFSVVHPKRQYVISGLSPGQCYNLWVTAWTDAGEGPRGSDLPFCTPSDSERMLSLVILAGGAVLLACLILLCICQFSSVHRRFLCCCQCLLPIIPDPANSKCAKTYADDQSEMKFFLDQCDSSVNEEPDNVEVEEVPYPPICTYIISFSQESSSSDATQITRITDITEDYISTHGAISGGEEEDEYEEERSLDEFEFFPSTHSPFLEPLVLTGGKLTLDVVKIDCSEFLDCT